VLPDTRALSGSDIEGTTAEPHGRPLLANLPHTSKWWTSSCLNNFGSGCRLTPGGSRESAVDIRTTQLGSRCSRGETKPQHQARQNQRTPKGSAHRPALSHQPTTFRSFHRQVMRGAWFDAFIGWDAAFEDSKPVVASICEKWARFRRKQISTITPSHRRSLPAGGTTSRCGLVVSWSGRQGTQRGRVPDREANSE
jgi:hypothetical protein